MKAFIQKMTGKMFDVPPVSAKHVDAGDGIRVIAVFLVAAFHIWQQSWLNPAADVGLFTLDLTVPVRSGYMLVDLMLMLSGFLLFLPYARSMTEGTKNPSVKEFYVKRAFRILPSYYLSVLFILFVFALPNGEYVKTSDMWQDLLTHLTFTHNFAMPTYVATKLNVVLWTLAVEVQFYLIFPLVAKFFKKKTALTFIVMVVAALAYRRFFVSAQQDTTIWFNGVPAMLDVYAIGMLASLLYVKLVGFLKHNRWTGIFFSIVAILCLLGIYHLMDAQRMVKGYAELRMNQMNSRFLLSTYGAVFIISGSMASGWMRWLLANRLVKFLSIISFNMYIWHQYLSVKLKEFHIPTYPKGVQTLPQAAGDVGWQIGYTVMCFAASIALAAAITYGFEKPIARWGQKKFIYKKKETHKK